MAFLKNELKIDSILRSMETGQAIVLIERKNIDSYISWGEPFNSEYGFHKMENLMIGANICANGKTVISLSKL